MGNFKGGQHFSWTSELGPNERFGIEDETAFQELAIRLEEKKKNKKPIQNQYTGNPMNTNINKSEKLIPQNTVIKNQLLDRLYTELLNYDKSRENAITYIEMIMKEDPSEKFTTNKDLQELISKSAAVQKLVNYYSKNFKKL